ncbi:MAG: FHA domain-containing protein [Candidatus Abyssobacteria bacterium SURF_17]|uniref:FHA domain-containing protein n=1 Tax=Candidatus Abyssobacteria bacterium SURF_17 TaxID=2093361 RepID=A0A419EQD6_9BACT|nr:MAG: FHA domain-containing protein [Candidatus Abyssubacteria bacterium SURF_17]
MTRCLVTGLIALVALHVATLCFAVEIDELYYGGGHEGGYAVAVRNCEFAVAGGLHFPQGPYRDIWVFKAGGSGELTGWNFFQGESEECAFGIAPTSDGYIIVGHTRSRAMGSASGSFDVFLIKTGSSLTEQVWPAPVTFGGTSDDHGFCVQPTKDGGYIVVGATQSYGASNFDVWLVKTDAHGTKLWDYPYGGADAEVGYSVQQTRDGGYIITGFKDLYGVSDRDVLLIKADPSGIVEWQKTFGGDKYDCGHSVRQTRDGGYIVAGWTESCGEGGRDAYFIKTDANGNAVWEKTIGAAYGDMVQCIVEPQLPGPGVAYVAAGWTHSHTHAASAWLVALGPEGQKVWDRVYTGEAAYYHGYAIEEVPCNPQYSDYIIAGRVVSTDNANSDDAFLIRSNYNGDIVWTKRYRCGHEGDYTDGPRNAFATKTTCQKFTSKKGAPIVRSEGSPQPADDRSRKRGVETRESLRARLLGLLMNQWIATERVYTTDGGRVDVAQLEEKPHELRLAKSAMSRHSEFPLQKEKVGAKECLAVGEIADNINAFVHAHGNGFTQQWQHQVREELVKELSEKCFKYGPPVPGVTLLKLNTNADGKDMKSAVIRKDGRECEVNKGDAIDKFRVIGMDSDTYSLLAKFGENGEVFRIWPADPSALEKTSAPEADAVAEAKPDRGEDASGFKGTATGAEGVSLSSSETPGVKEDIFPPAKSAEPATSDPGTEHQPAPGASLKKLYALVTGYLERRKEESVLTEARLRPPVTPEETLDTLVTGETGEPVGDQPGHGIKQRLSHLNPYVVLTILYVLGLLASVFFIALSRRVRKIRHFTEGEAELVFSQNPENIEKITIGSEQVYLGRDPNNDIVLPDPAISRKHSVIRGSGSVFTISDLESRNGLRVNGQKVKHAHLHNGDAICVGRFVMTFRCRNTYDEGVEENVKDAVPEIQ